MRLSLNRGRSDVRMVLAMMNAERNVKGAAAYAASRWGHSVAAEVEATMKAKAAVGAVGTGELGGPLPGFSIATLLPTAIERSVLRVFYELPFEVPILAGSGEANAYWVGQGRPKPLTRTQLTATRLPARKIAALELFSIEALRALDDASEADFQRRLERAIVRLLDQTFIDPLAAAIADQSPASITNGLTPIPYVSDIVESFGNALEAHSATSDLQTTVAITDAKTAFKLGAATNGAGISIYPGASVRGGELAGIPLLVTRGSPRDSSGGQLVLADTAQVGVAFGDLRVDRSMHTALEMVDNPTDPTSATVLVSLFQSNLAALKLEVDANWLAQPGAVTLLAGIP